MKGFLRGLLTGLAASWSIYVSCHFLGILDVSHKQNVTYQKDEKTVAWQVFPDGTACINVPLIYRMNEIKQKESKKDAVQK